MEAASRQSPLDNYSGNDADTEGSLAVEVGAGRVIQGSRLRQLNDKPQTLRVSVKGSQPIIKNSPMSTQNNVSPASPQGVVGEKKYSQGGI